MRLSYPWGTTLHIFYFTAVHRKTSFFGWDRSWQLTDLLYHALRVDYYFCLTTKITLLQLKYSHLRHLVFYMHFPGTPPCTDIITSFWVMWVRTQDIHDLQHLCFQPITVSSYTYLVISIHDRTPRIPLLLPTCLIMPIDKVIIQTIFMVLFTSGSFSHLGETLRCLIWHLPQVFICYPPSPNYIFFLQILHDDWLCLLYARLWYVGEGPCLIMGVPQHLPLITAISYFIHNPVGALLPHQPKGLGGHKEKCCNDIAFLLVFAKEEATGDRKYSLSTIWVNPCQARVPSMAEALKELTTWVSSGPN